MTLRTGNLNVFAAELVEPGKSGWEDVIEVFTRALDEEQERGERYAPSVDSVFGDALAPVNLCRWLVYAPGHGLAVWSAEDVARRLPDAPVKKRKPPKRCMFVWRDADGWHQCEQRRSVRHGHTESRFLVMEPRGRYARRCLGLSEKGGPAAEPWVQQCGLKRRLCQQPHMFFAKTRMDEDAPATSEPEPQRCLWVWHDAAGWHQCTSCDTDDHGHDEAPGIHVELETEGEPRCLGLWTLERQPGEVQVLQCPRSSAECDSYHPFYARRIIGEET